jgi:hypothetical protein
MAGGWLEDSQRRLSEQKRRDEQEWLRLLTPFLSKSNSPQGRPSPQHLHNHEPTPHLADEIATFDPSGPGTPSPCPELVFTGEYQLTHAREWGHIVKDGSPTVAVLSCTAPASGGNGIFMALLDLSDSLNPVLPAAQDWRQVDLAAGDVSDIWHVFSNGSHWISYADESREPRLLHLLRVRNNGDGTFSRTGKFDCVSYDQYSYSTVAMGPGDPVDIIQNGNTIAVETGWEKIWGGTNDHVLLAEGPGGGPSIGMAAAFDYGSGLAFMHLDAAGQYFNHSHVGAPVQGVAVTELGFGGPGASGNSREIWQSGTTYKNKTWDLFLSGTLRPAQPSVIAHVLVGPELSATGVAGGQVLTADIGRTTHQDRIVLLEEDGYNLSMPSSILQSGCWLVTYRRFKAPASSDDGEIFRAWFTRDFVRATPPEKIASHGGTCSRPHTTRWQVKGRPGVPRSVADLSKDYVLTLYAANHHQYLRIDAVKKRAF